MTSTGSASQSEAATETGHSLFAAIQAALGPEASRHRGVDAPGRRDTVIAGGSYRAIGALVDGFRAGDADVPVTGIVVASRASTAVLKRAVALGANIVISRNAFLGDSQDRPVAKPEPALAEKLDFIARNKLAVLRLQDPRVGASGRAIATALARAAGLEQPRPDFPLERGLAYGTSGRVIDHIRRIKAAIPTKTVRLIGDPSMPVSGLAIATETNRPNALAPLISRPGINLLVSGEVHETETSAYVMDAISLGQKKALLLVGSIAMEEPAAKALAAWLPAITRQPVHYLPSIEGLQEVV